jgi:hypothetical protein
VEEIMKPQRSLTLIVVSALLMLGTVSPTWAGQGKMAAPAEEMGLYNPQTEATVTGIVEVITDAPTKRGMPGLQVTLKTATGEAVLVHLGPAAFLEKYEFPIVTGDTLRVVGSSVATADEQFVIAKAVKKDGTEIVLRDDDGFPFWATRRRRQ